MPKFDEIKKFLQDGGYANADEWMADSDYECIDGEWCYEGTPVDPAECIFDAMEASKS